MDLGDDQVFRYVAPHTGEDLETFFGGIVVEKCSSCSFVDMEVSSLA